MIECTPSAHRDPAERTTLATVMKKLLAVVLASLALAPFASSQRLGQPPGPPKEIPRPEFSAAPLAGIGPLEVQFTAQAKGTLLWEFGDGATSTEASPTHVYESLGVYSVKLTVTNLSGTVELSKANYIQVTALPTGFAEEVVLELDESTTMFLVLDAEGTDFAVVSKRGVVRRWRNGSYNPLPLADLSEEVSNWADHGMHGFAYHPDYATNGYVYFYYVVDRHHLDHFGTPEYDPAANEFDTETIGRLTRYQVYDPSDPETTVDPATRTVLIGADAASGIAVCAGSHGLGRLTFGEDGSLLLTAGDASLGTSFQAECVASGILTTDQDLEAFRAQYLDSPNGKILRLDPLTGEGMPSNPFYDGANPGGWPSRVWALGLRNPYRFALAKNDAHRHAQSANHPGTILIGDVGDQTWEEISVVENGGENLGWPLYEGYEAHPWWGSRVGQFPVPGAPNPLAGGGCADNFLFDALLLEDSLNPPFWPNPCDPLTEVPATLPRYVHTRPILAYQHLDNAPEGDVLVKDYDVNGDAITRSIDDPLLAYPSGPFGGNCAIGGVWFSGDTYPEPYRNAYYFGDFGEGWMKALKTDANYELTDLFNFSTQADFVTYLTTDTEERALYYLRYWGGRAIRRIVYGANVKPVAVAEVTATYGPRPLRVELDSANSTDPENATLETSWDLDTDQPWTPLNELPRTVHIYPSEDITLEAELITSRRRRRQNLEPSTTPPSPAPDAPEVHDLAWEEVGSTSTASQLVVVHRNPYVGYLLPEPRALTALVYQEGLNEGSDGDFLIQPVVEYWDEELGVWRNVTGLQVFPSYRETMVDPSRSYETFHFSWDAVETTAVRLRDAKRMGGGRRMTVGELRLLALPDPMPTAPASYRPSVTVTDPFGAFDVGETLVSVDNTPPVISITSPAAVQTYPVGVTNETLLDAMLSDEEHDVASLACEWTVELVHDNHSHPEPPITSCTHLLTMLPHEELLGDIVYWQLTLRVTDPEGLTSTAQARLIPEGDCNLNGILDADDILNGTSQDTNLNGIPDECE